MNKGQLQAQADLLIQSDKIFSVFGVESGIIDNFVRGLPEGYQKIITY